MEPRNQHFNKFPMQVVLGEHRQMPACRAQSWLLSLDLSPPHSPTPCHLSFIFPPTPKPLFQAGFSLLTTMCHISPVLFLKFALPLIHHPTSVLILSILQGSL